MDAWVIPSRDNGHDDGRTTGPATEGPPTGGHVGHLAVERNAGWARLLSERHPEVDVVVADAREPPVLLADRGITHVDAVIGRFTSRQRMIESA